MVNKMLESEEPCAMDKDNSQVSTLLLVDKSVTSQEISEPHVFECKNTTIAETICPSETTVQPADGYKQNGTPHSQSNTQIYDPENFVMPTINGSDQMRIDDLIGQGTSPIDIIRAICPNLNIPLETLSANAIFMILHDLLDRNPIREKLPIYNTFDDAIELFRRSKKILILTGAGVSVSCGIPDFRSKNGIYARLHIDFPDLPDPTSMFDIEYFMRNPAPFYDFAREIFPGQFEPSVSHKFIKALEDNGQLLRNFTQNIDTLERQTGIQRVVECHGSFSKATCLKCKTKFEGDIIKQDVIAKRVARCPVCLEGVIKPDIVFFGEDLGQNFHNQMNADKDEADLLIVIGSSLKVRPVSLIPYSVKPDVPQILINREPLSNYKSPDIQLLGDCDEIVRDLCIALGGTFEKMLREHDEKIAEKDPEVSVKPPSYNLRRCIDQNGFKKVISNLTENREQIEQNIEETRVITPENKNITNMEESRKRKLEEIEADTEAKRRRYEESLEEIRKFYERRFVNVQANLPEDAYFQVGYNQFVFKGAELYYDLDDECFIAEPHRLLRNSSSSASSDSDDESSENDTSVEMRSEPGDALKFEPFCPEVDESSRHARSCMCDIDVETRISTQQAKAATHF